MPYTRLISLDGCFNLRDLGGYSARSGQTAWRKVFRADSLHRLKVEDLIERCQMQAGTVIDLRGDEELAAQPNPFATGLTGVSYHNVPLFDKLDPTNPALKDEKDLLFTVYCQALAECGLQVAKTMRLIAGASNGVLFHCTAGKDRTGMIAAFLLSLARVSRTDIIADYCLTAEQAPAMFHALQLEIEEAGGKFDIASPLLRSDAATMAAFLDHLDDTYGGVERYLLSVGMTCDELSALRRLVLQNDMSERVA